MLKLIKKLLTRKTLKCPRYNGSGVIISELWEGYYDYIGAMEKILHREIIGDEENYYFLKYWRRQFPNLTDEQILNYEGLPPESINCDRCF